MNDENGKTANADQTAKTDSNGPGGRKWTRMPFSTPEHVRKFQGAVIRAGMRKELTHAQVQVYVLAASRLLDTLKVADLAKEIAMLRDEIRAQKQESEIQPRNVRPSADKRA